MDLLSSFSILGWNPSGPADLDIFNFKSFFSTISGVITIPVRLSSYGRSFRVGIITVSSLVNTLGWTGKDGSPSPTLGTIIKILW